MKTSKVGMKALLAVMAVAVFASGCSAGGASTIDTPASTKRPAATAHHGGVSSHLSLPTRTIVAGGSVRGTLVISNKTGRAIHWNCGYLQVQLVNAQWPLEVHPTPCSLHGKTLRVGTTRLPFTLSARQVVCQGSCTAMPPGTYRTRLFSGPLVAHPGPRTVHVVARTASTK